ncbi:hypothetical protein WB66_00020 [bacteria symbiont BFo1 of Frankliniella occidentalis]|jgi:DNA-binding transcriptional LysR family regulator|uniref:LysR family transcriptional regulator n=1 Tax=Erwinia aphidicola TaxID=68334 RepID=UPI000789CA28|nr:LysR family transcriptional regulator [Erwinia aphidicola]KYP86869.1 hypothetical protein WB66_00020 [bacteria symbiont BFo1 of Frankliniella occidentalis]KYP92676.1 hypothetical protein WB91_00250 [bacteria symbiont BFo1 of Frankliniella occidentalis]PIJ50604.1 hypothetical protein BOM23_23135 [Erwinia sp. OLMDLW33]CAH0307353.1 HTH-type transcriptional regulator CysL [Erwinia aphidicola]
MKKNGDLSEWKVFINVVEAGSFSQAAINMGISISSVSKKIRKLEEGVNTQLLNRDTHSFEVTQAGKMAYESATAAVEMMSDLVFKLRNSSRSIEGAIKLTAPAMVCEFLANFWLDEYSDKNKDVTIFLESRESNQFTKESSAFDHLVLKSGVIVSDELVHRELSPLKISLCASRSYLEREGTPIHPRDLHNHRLLNLYHHGFPNTITFKNNNERFLFTNRKKNGYTTDNLLGNFNLMLQGRGISLATSGFLSHYGKNYPSVVTVLGEWEIPPIPVYLVWRQRKFYTPLFKDFSEFISDRWNGRDLFQKE